MEILTSLQSIECQEEGKDLGKAIREQSKLLISLLNDPNRLKNERTKMAAQKKNISRCATEISFVSEQSFEHKQGCC